MFSEKNRRQITLWHRRLGLVLLVWIFLVALSGIALNHSAEFGLDQRLDSRLLLKRYGVNLAPLQSLTLDNHWLTMVGSDRIFFDTTLVEQCQNLTGTARLGEEYWIGCSDKVLVINRQGQLVERMTAAVGLPLPVTLLGNCGDVPCLNSQDGQYRLDPGRFIWEKNATPAELDTVKLVLTPEPLRNDLMPHHVPGEFTWTRLIKDLHSGVFFGLGPWLMDIFAVALMSLSVIGTSLWWLNRKRRRSRYGD